MSKSIETSAVASKLLGKKAILRLVYTNKKGETKTYEDLVVQEMHKDFVITHDGKGSIKRFNFDSVSEVKA